MNHRKFKFTPAWAIQAHLGRYVPQAYGFERRFAAYQYYVAKMDEWHTKVLRKREGRDYRERWEYLNATSSIHNSEPNPIFNFDAPFKRLADLFSHVGETAETGAFLHYCGLTKLADLAKPIVIPISHSEDFPQRSWFHLRGRRFKVSPNPSHPPAVWVMSGSVQINRRGTLWNLRIEYGYVHDSSHWFYEIYQEKGEQLDAFAQRANKELEAQLEPDTFGENRREQDERDWGRTYKALRALFSEPYTLGDWQPRLTDLLTGIQGTSLTACHIELTKDRLRTLERWIKQSAEERKAK